MVTKKQELHMLPQ